MSNGNGSGFSGGARLVHITRIYQNNDKNSGVWVDVERLDGLYVVQGSPGQYVRDYQWSFDWEGSFDPTDTVNNDQKKLVDPTADKDDTSSQINFPARKVVLVVTDAGIQFQGFKHFFVNDQSNNTRETYSRRVYHHDIDEKNLDENGQPPSNPTDYLNALGDQNPDQYIDVEILDKYWTREITNRDSLHFTKETQWQEKKWSSNDQSDTELADPLLRVPLRDSDDTSGDQFNPVYNPGAGPQIDPPWRIDPLQNIVNISWGEDEYKLVVFRQGLQGLPQSVIAFTTPETFFTSSEIKSGELDAPTFGGTIFVPTATLSPNGTYPGAPPFQDALTVVTGNSLEVAQPIGAPDYRGYTTMIILEFQEGLPVSTGQFIYFDYKGKHVNKKSPPMSKIARTRGSLLAKDEFGTVYVRSSTVYPGDEETPPEGITKYDDKGDILWSSSDDDEPGPRVLCANYDPKTKHITFVLSDQTIHVWDMGGNEVSVAVIPSGYILHDVSKKGKIYALREGKSVQYDAIAAFSPAGEMLWETRARLEIKSCTAFGEIWIVAAEIVDVRSKAVGTYEAGPGGGGGTVISETDPGPGYSLKTLYTTSSLDFEMVVYDAKHGGMVGSEFWARNSSDSTTGGHPAEGGGRFNIGSYAELGFARSAYFP